MSKEAREHKVTILLNASEMRAVERYCKQYKIRNRSKMIREMVIRGILGRWDEDGPTLF